MTTTVAAHASLTTGLTRCSQLDPRPAAIESTGALGYGERKPGDLRGPESAGRQRRPIGQDLPWLAIGGDATAVEHDDPVGDLREVRQVM